MPSQRLLATVALPLLVGCASSSGGAPAGPPVKITAMQWAFDPPTVMLAKGTAVQLELTSKDVHHRFYLPDFGIDVDVDPGTTTSVAFTPDRDGTFPFRCEYYCGQGHEGMVGRVVVQ